MTNASTVVSTLRGLETRTLRSGVTSRKNEESLGASGVDGASNDDGLSTTDEDLALARAEEKMMIEEDEEIDSHDEEGIPVVDTEKLENRMLTVAIVKSVVETSGGGASPNSHRYGLRKRRRPSAKKGEETPRSSGGRSTRSNPSGSPRVTRSSPTGSPRTTRSNGKEKSEEQSVLKSTPSSEPALKAEIVISGPVAAEDEKVVKQGRKTDDRVTCTNVPNPLANSTPPPETVSKAASSVDEVKANNQGSGTSTTVQTRPQIAATLSAPTSQTTSQPNAQHEQPLPHPATESRARRGRIFSIDIDPAGLDFPDLGIVGTMSQQSELSKTAPLPPISATVSGGAPAPAASATTSGPATTSTTSQAQPVGITVAQQPPKQQSGDVTNNTDLIIVGRDRAMSFEFFSFGLNHDEPLPPAPDPNSSSSELVGRPRGDSIIFDPCSFRDGGILEENVLLKSRGNSLDITLNEEVAIMNEPGFAPAPTSIPLHVSSTDTGVPSSVVGGVGGTTNTSYILPSRNDSSQIAPAPTQLNNAGSSSSSLVKSSSSAQMATLPSSLSGSSMSHHSTFQMELLNKDGRIGIYLPEARKERIAKFHSKRKMRIWRKRIKYDCRKKLADSRPRIKGRFVKRSDMEEEED